jgi:hypothetical protein
MEDLGLFFDPSLSDEPLCSAAGGNTTKPHKKDRTGKCQRGFSGRSLTFADLKSAPLDLKEKSKDMESAISPVPRNSNGYFFGTVRTRLHSSYRYYNADLMKH